MSKYAALMANGRKSQDVETEMNIQTEELASINFSDVADGEKLPPVTPGEILLEEYLLPMGITQYRLAKEIGVPQPRIGEIITGKRGITIDTALRLSRYFGMSDGFWIWLQIDYDSALAKQVMGDALANIHPYEHPV